jgi:hypothetical protein
MILKEQRGVVEALRDLLVVQKVVDARCLKDMVQDRSKGDRKPT